MAILKRRLRVGVSASLAAGLKLYQAFTLTLVGGVPEILGAAAWTGVASRNVKSRQIMPYTPVAGVRFIEMCMCSPHGLAGTSIREHYHPVASQP